MLDPAGFVAVSVKVTGVPGATAVVSAGALLALESSGFGRTTKASYDLLPAPVKDAVLRIRLPWSPSATAEGSRTAVKVSRNSALVAEFAGTLKPFGSVTRRRSRPPVASTVSVVPGGTGPRVDGSFSRGVLDLRLGHQWSAQQPQLQLGACQ